MIRRWFSVIAALYCILALAPSASAECAWVLWHHLTTPGLPPYGQTTIAGAFESLKDCRDAVRRSYLSDGTPADSIAGLIDYPDRSWFGKRADGGDRIIRYVCLPDTIDPRGPKGK